MDQEAIKQQTYDFMDQQKLAVVSTVSVAGMPEAALVGFGSTLNFEIIFGTNKATRKYANIMHNPHVALVIGWDEDRTVQLEGVARELTDSPKDRGLVESAYWAKNPSAKRYSDIAGQVYFAVQVIWVRLVVKPHDEYEFTLP